jgi:hypothetical protein
MLSLRVTKPFSAGLEPRTFFGVVAFVHVISPPKQTIFSLALLFFMLSYRATEIIFTRTRTQGRFFGNAAFVPVISLPKKNFGLGVVLLPCSVSELKKPSSMVLEPMTVFRNCGLCSRNLSTETSKSGLALFFYSA